MLLFNPMWNHENERLGCRHCSPTAYALHVLSDYCSLAAILYLIGRLTGLLPGSAWYALLLWLAGRLLYVCYGLLVIRRGFVYDYESATATWHDRRGIRRHYPPADGEATVGKPAD